MLTMIFTHNLVEKETEQTLSIKFIRYKTCLAFNTNNVKDRSENHELL